MPAVVRVKRRVDEEPLSAFVLNGKKRRLDGGTAEEAGAFAQDVFGETEDVSTVLKFAGTIEQQDNNVTSRFARLNKEQAKELVQQKSKRLINTTEKARQQTRQAMQENRFKIVNCMRTTLNLEENEDAIANSVSADDDNAVASGSQGATAPNQKEVTIVDIEKQSGSTHPLGAESLALATEFIENTDNEAGGNNLSQPSDSDTGYVYDLYLPENEQQAENVDLMDNNHLSVRVFDDLFYEDRFNDEQDDRDENDSEDSNQENYFTNDYPDEDEEFDGAYCNGNEESDDQREMRRAVRRFVFDDDDEHEALETSDDDDFDPYHENGYHQRTRRLLQEYDPDVSRGFGNRPDAYYDDEEDNYYEDSDEPNVGSAEETYRDSDEADSRIM